MMAMPRLFIDPTLSPCPVRTSSAQPHRDDSEVLTAPAADRPRFVIALPHRRQAAQASLRLVRERRVATVAQRLLALPHLAHLELGEPDDRVLVDVAGVVRGQADDAVL